MAIAMISTLQDEPKVRRGIGEERAGLEVVED
jgi:hypothetical protein